MANLIMEAIEDWRLSNAVHFENGEDFSSREIASKWAEYYDVSHPPLPGTVEYDKSGNVGRRFNEDGSVTISLDGSDPEL